jgi:hypothetical protein
VTGKNRIMIYGPKDDGTYVVEVPVVEHGRSKATYIFGDALHRGLSIAEVVRFLRRTEEEVREKAKWLNE